MSAFLHAHTDREELSLRYIPGIDHALPGAEKQSNTPALQVLTHLGFGHLTPDATIRPERKQSVALSESCTGAETTSSRSYPASRT